MNIKIKSRYDGHVMFAGEFGSLKLALEAAVKSGSDLSDSNLSGSNLSGSDLRGSDLRGSDLRGSDLRGSNLSDIKHDLWAVLCTSPLEVEGLRQALLDGKVDGSTYDGECACLVGTIANIKKCKYDAIPSLKPDSDRPAERFFLAIKKGDTPKKSQFAKLAVEWIEEWQKNMSVLSKQPA